MCGKCELPLTGHYETTNSDNPGVFRSILDFVCQCDSSPKMHLESGKVFKGISKTIQNELLESILEECQKKIKQEIAESDYLAVMCDDTTDVSEKPQMVIVFRFEIKGKNFERFWSFFNPQNQTAKELPDILLRQLRPIIGNHSTILIAQCYDGTVNLSGTHNGVQAITKKTYPSAHFVHCYAHKLNLILQKATSVNRNVKVFFSSVSGVSEFFPNHHSAWLLLKMQQLEAGFQGPAQQDETFGAELSIVFMK